ncbi:MAG: sulfatase [Phycisphaerales bacterium]|nr:sulfatase [Phycisphaerales bacterium]
MITRRTFLGQALIASALTAFLAVTPTCNTSPPPPSSSAAPHSAANQRLNVLLLTVDDMNYDTPNFAGGIAPDVTPNLDALAKQSLRFVNAHVTVAVCQPSRQTLMTGRYPHRSGSVGFVPINADCPTLQESLNAAGYDLGIIGKVSHLRPYEKYHWDYRQDADDLNMGRDPQRYYETAKEFFTKVKADNKPFFLMANSHDPHRPFAGSLRDIQSNLAPATLKRASGEPGDAVTPMKHPAPARIYKPEEVRVPGFLPDLPNVRKEVAQYASSCHRADESIGAVLRALRESGLEDNTVIFFLSDNGMSFPFAKQNCYLTSTRTPLFVKWPGHTKPGVNTQDFVTGIDFMPTVLDIVNVPAPAGMDGRSYVPLLNGQKQENRNNVFTVYDAAVNPKNSFPMRCVQDQHFGYIYNDWAGKSTYTADGLSDLTFNAMKEAAKTDSAIANRVEFCLHRVPEELYDLEHDPACLHNLINDPAYKSQVASYRQQLLTWMRDVKDPYAVPFEKVVNP